MAIWINGHHDPKFGNEWGNFWFTMTICLMFLGVQCGCLLMGNIISAVITGKAFTLTTVTVSVFFTLWDANLIALRSDIMQIFFLFGMPGICAVATVFGSVLVKRGHPTTH